jgi:molybdopterin molybdotransferase
MTGAMIPQGADCVVMVEDTLPMEDNQVEFLKDLTSKNICFQGEDIKKGDLVLDKGLKIKPADVAVLATVGAVNPLVFKLPRIGIISTGDELVEPSSTPGKAQIRNSNAIQLEAQVRQVPAEPTYYGIAPDDGPSLRLIIETALASNDLVLLTGGVSMGDFDFVPAVMQKAGIDILFKSIAIQPGKPTVFGRRNQNYIFGLPGNPVSSYMLFEILVKPFILKLTGHYFQPREIMLPIGRDYTRRKSERKSMIPVQIKDGIVYPVDYHGSAHIHAYSKADGVLVMEIGTTHVKLGDPVHVRLL